MFNDRRRNRIKSKNERTTVHTVANNDFYSKNRKERYAKATEFVDNLVNEKKGKK